ncbi:ricin-type beta-trefoil lectin domain protein [Streptomyces sp. ISL-12]|uniref:RICIN domain-containing protein n=1 Tax=Streptomyces sp. ISL-12 TaxID=2819177 RepID=UPI001BE7E655|nr:RICIN domain-containing protein [Streptomyces sp. ISL-12]MBT2413271.1 ricin-type beta-trefoil lectin domain protein [Streptomyces sp. ISL-12]
MSRDQTRSPDASSSAAGGGTPGTDVRRAVAMSAVPADPGAALAPAAGNAAAVSAETERRPDERQPEAAAPVGSATSSSARAGGLAALLSRRADRSDSVPAAEESTRGRAADTAETASMAAVAPTAATAARGDREEDGDGVRGGNPKKPLLAAAGLAGVVLIGMPLLILATDDDDKQDRTVSVGQTAPRPEEDVADVPLGDYAAQEPSDEPSAPSAEATKSPAPEEKQKKSGGGDKDQEATAQASPSPGTSTQPRSASRRSVTVLKQETSAPSSAAPSVRTFKLVSSDTGKCLTGSATAGTQLVIRACDGSAAQQWKFANDGTIRTKGMCLDLFDGTKSTEAKVEVWPCNGEAWQQFRLDAAGELVSQHSGHCLDVWHGKSDGTKVTTWLCNGQPNQRWSRA